MDNLFAEKRDQLKQRQTQLLGEIGALKDQLAAIELELGAINAYDEYKAQGGNNGRTVIDGRTAPSDARRRTITRDAVASVVEDAGESGIGRADILGAMGVKGNKNGEAAVDNRLRDLKKSGRVLHEGRVYRFGEK